MEAKFLATVYMSASWIITLYPALVCCNLPKMIFSFVFDYNYCFYPKTIALIPNLNSGTSSTAHSTQH